MFDILSEKFANAFKNLQGKGKISEDNIENTLKEVRTALLEADVNFKVVRTFVEEVKAKAIGAKVIKGVNPGEQFIKIVHDELALLMGDANNNPGPELNFPHAGPLPILVVGLNGQGKTTFSGKLAWHLERKKNKKVLLVPADTFRPAAKDQLGTLAQKMGVTLFDSDLSMSPHQIVTLALEQAKLQQKDVVIIDTAGRLHVDQELMVQIREVRDGLAFLQPEVLLVADAMTGQEAVNVARVFHETVQLTGVVLSKMDSDARGGAALSIRQVTGVPIRYLSTGEKMADLELFHADRLAKRILDMGDVLSLVEKAEEAIDEQEAEKMLKKMQKGRFSIKDFMQQMEMISNLGPMEHLLKMIPGMGGVLRQVGDLGPAKEEMKRMKVVVQSMTEAERENYRLLNDSRIKRIAQGSGRLVSEVKGFITKFQQMEKMMGQMLGMMGGPGQLGNGGMLPQKGFRSPLPATLGADKKGKTKGKKRGPWGRIY